MLSLEEDALVFLELFPGFGSILEQVEVMSCFDEFPRPILSRPSKTTAEEMGELVKSRASASRFEDACHVPVYRGSREAKRGATPESVSSCFLPP